MLTLAEWVAAKLTDVKDYPSVLVRDPLHLLAEGDTDVHAFAQANEFTAVVAATNLVFRELYERVLVDPDVSKVIVVDRTPKRRLTDTSGQHSPPLFYPDLLARTPPLTRIDLDLRQFLAEATGDPSWPSDANDSRYAPLIIEHLDGIGQAHANLRAANLGRFTDFDFKTIIAYAALGVADRAFKTLDPRDYWTIGLFGHAALERLERVAPEVTGVIKGKLKAAPEPFRWFADRDPDVVVRGFYLAAIVEQHLDQWSLVLANLDPSLRPFAGVSAAVLRESASTLVAMNPVQAAVDLASIEDNLDRAAIEFLSSQMKLTTPAGFADAIEKERYSALLRSLALLAALDDLLAAKPAESEQARVGMALFSESPAASAKFVDTRPSPAWNDLREAYRLARDIRTHLADLAAFARELGVLTTDQLGFDLFWSAWNEKKMNRLEYQLSALDRLVGAGHLLPRPKDELPSAFADATNRVRQRVRGIIEEATKLLEVVNLRFQDLVARRYVEWAGGTGNVDGDKRVGGKRKGATSLPTSLPLFPSSPVLTSQFLSRCLKPYWDPQTEKAVLFIFDGMRYDIWDEFLQPMLLERMDPVADLMGSSLIPSETQLTRKAISAGTFPESFDSRSGEDQLLKAGLARELGYITSVATAAPEGSGTGETVRFRAGNLDVYIFELCDRELHRIKLRTLPDGREAPSRPLAFIYEQHIKNILDTEVAAIVRGIAPGTKVFITADHGFGPVRRERIWFDAADLNEPDDCSYLNSWLKVSFDKASLSTQFRANIVAFTPDQLRMPKSEVRSGGRGGAALHKEYRSIVFPRIGHAFSRSGSPFDPDAYSHGGISIQELMIPMVVLKVKPRDGGLITLGPIEGPAEVVEGEEVAYRLRLSRPSAAAESEDLRVNVEANYGHADQSLDLPHQVVYLATGGAHVNYRFKPDASSATTEERRAGEMKRTLTVTVSYRNGQRAIRRAQSRSFTVRLRSDQVIRRVGNLGGILGLTPRILRG